MAPDGLIAKTDGKALNVVYVWDADYPWDVRAEKTCLALTQAGHNVHMVARNRKHAQTIERLAEATVHRMPQWRWMGRRLDAALGFPAFFNPRWHSLIAKTAVEENADVIIVRDIPLCPAAISVGRRLGVPVILDMAEHYPAMMRAIWETGRQRPLDWLIRNPKVVERVEHFCIRNVSHIFTVADEMTDRLATMGVERSRMTRVGNTPSLSANRDVATDREHVVTQIYVVYLGLLEVVRGIDDLIDAVAILRNRNLPVSLLLIGSGRDEWLFRERVKARGLTSDDVVFTGQLPYSEALGRMAQADIAVLPLHRNPHMDTTVPNKLFDYMSVGLPIVTSDTIPSARIVLAENAGVVFRARDVEGLSNAIRSLFDAKVRRFMGTNGQAAIAQKYNWETDSSRMIETVVRVALGGR